MKNTDDGIKKDSIFEKMGLISEEIMSIKEQKTLLEKKIKSLESDYMQLYRKSIIL